MCHSLFRDLGSAFVYGDLVLESQWVELSVFEFCHTVLCDGNCIPESYILFEQFIDDWFRVRC